MASFGCASFGAREIYGLTPDGPEADSVPSVIFATRDERRHGLPERFVVIEDPGSDEQFVLDTLGLGTSGEARLMGYTYFG